MSYERKGKETKREDFWATLCRDDDSAHGETSVSPVFENQPELVGWIRTHRRDGDDVTMMRREISAGGFKDVVLLREPEPLADPERLRAMLAGVKDGLLEQRERLGKKATSVQRPLTRTELLGPFYGPPEPGEENSNG